MTCPLCRQRKAKRQCPALGQTICAVCCATKREKEIACPATCAHLTAGRDHPAAVVRRQQERDVAALLPSMRGLTERQQQLYFLFQTVIASQKPDGLARLVDLDVAEGAAAAAATLETAARGLIYEHTPPSVLAQRLAREFQALLARVREHGAKVFDREAALVLRAIERGARETHDRAPDAPDPQTAYLTVMARLLHISGRGPTPADGADTAGPGGPGTPGSLIVP